MTMALLLSKFDELLHFLMPNDCFEQILYNYNLFDGGCLPLVFSRVLGLGITVCSLILFLPQILKIQLAQSVHGISLASNLLALVASASAAAYSFVSGFVFSQWGDSLFVTIQLMIITIQILWFTSRQAYAGAFIAFFWMITYALINDYIPYSVLTLLQASVIPIVIVSKLLQAYATYKQESTGQLSLITVMLQFGGCLARVFTSIKETGDHLVIASYVIATVMNGIIFSQFLIYRSTITAGEKKPKKE